MRAMTVRPPMHLMQTMTPMQSRYYWLRDHHRNLKVSQ
jgi:hypothetical protein